MPIEPKPAPVAAEAIPAGSDQVFREFLEDIRNAPPTTSGTNSSQPTEATYAGPSAQIQMSPEIFATPTFPKNSQNPVLGQASRSSLHEATYSLGISTENENIRPTAGTTLPAIETLLSESNSSFVSLT